MVLSTRALAVAALAVAALTSTTDAVYKRTCEDRFPDQYAVIKTKMQTCEGSSKITMALPLTVKQKQVLCAKCADLAEMTQADNWPACTVISEGVATNLRVQFRNFFKPCLTAGSDDSSKTDDDAKPATVAPTSGGNGNNSNGGAPATTESPTTSDTPATSKTPKPSKTPKASKVSTKEDSDDGSGSAGNKATKTPKPTTKAPKTPKPKTPKANRNSTSAANGTDASASSDVDSEASDADSASAKSTKLKNKTNSTSPGDTTTQSKASSDSAISTGAIVGIIAGVVALVMVSAAFVVLRHRRKHSSASDKRPATELAAYDSHGHAISSFSPVNPFQFSRASTATNASGSVMHAPPNFAASYSSVASATSQASTAPAQTSLWQDEVIIAARIPKDKVVPTVLIARGAFGEVYQGVYNRQPVAIKTLLPEMRADLQEINALLAEVKLMATLEHERIVTFIGVAWDSLHDLCVVSEFMDGGDLRGLLTQYENDRRPHGFDHDKIKIALHVAHALTYLHSLRPIVLHRDLKSKNILLDSQLNAKLTDFGVSRESSYRTMTAGVGTSLWMAPEVMLGGRYDEKADVFSFGVVLSEIDTHAMPYENVRETESGKRLPDNALLQLVAEGQLSVAFSTDDESTAEIAALGRACVALDPTDRPTAVNVLYAMHSALKNAYVVM